MPNFANTFTIKVNAYEQGMGAILTQERRPLAYLSKAISPKNMGLSTYEKEFLAILLAVTKWKHYSSPKPFVIKTYHESLKHLLKQRITTTIQQKGMLKLMGLEYTSQYKKAKENLATYALSRRGLEEGSVQTLTTVIPTWVKEVSKSYEGDSKAQQIIAEVLLQPGSQVNYSYQQGVLRYKGRIYIGNKGTLRKELIDHMHAS